MVALLPVAGATDVCIDTRLTLTFDEVPVAGSSGMVRVTDLATGEVVDSIDMSIAAGPNEGRTYGEECDYVTIPYNYSRQTIPTNRNTRPGTPSHREGAYDSSDDDIYQLNIIGGFTDGFHFHPIIVKGHSATICLHNNTLEYSHTYRVTIEGSVITAGGEPFKGISEDDGWIFTTKSGELQGDTLRVNAAGTAGFCTIQGAMDAIEDWSNEPRVVAVAAGDYEEIVYFRNKSNVTIIGAGTESTRVHYANNEIFNPHPKRFKTNERRGTFPSRRAAFAIDHCEDITIKDITIATDLTGQAEGLLINGERVTLRRVHIIGSGDALQANGTVFMDSCTLDGGGDTILGRGTLFARRCTFRNSGGAFTWVRNGAEDHGDIFVECTFETIGGAMADYGRTRANHGSTYPDAEVVLIDCRVKNIIPEGWSRADEPTVKLYEHNTRDTYTGEAVDTSKRHPYSRQLDAVNDAALIQAYRNPAFTLKGWQPE